MPNGRCRIHGGKTPSGAAVKHFRTGRYARSVPVRLAADYDTARSDADLLALRDEIALLDARLNDLLTGVSNGEAGELWKRLKDALREYDDAARSSAKDAEGRKSEAFGNIRWLVNEGYQEWMSWMEIRHTLEDRRRLVDSERARLKDMQQMISSESAMTLISAIVGAVQTHVRDRAALAAIANDVRRITGDVGR